MMALVNKGKVVFPPPLAMENYLERHTGLQGENARLSALYMCLLYLARRKGADLSGFEAAVNRLFAGMDRTLEALNIVKERLGTAQTLDRTAVDRLAAIGRMRKIRRRLDEIRPACGWSMPDIEAEQAEQWDGAMADGLLLFDRLEEWERLLRQAGVDAAEWREGLRGWADAAAELKRLLEFRCLPELASKLRDGLYDEARGLAVLLHAAHLVRRKLGLMAGSRGYEPPISRWELAMFTNRVKWAPDFSPTGGWSLETDGPEEFGDEPEPDWEEIF